MNEALVSSPGGVVAVLCAVAAAWFLIAQLTGWKLFQYVPPLIFTYATPVFLNNFGVLPQESPVYPGLSEYLLSAFIVLMLIKVDVASTVRIMGRGIWVFLMGTAGVVSGAVISFALVHRWLGPDAWTGVGALAGSWIGGTGNMAAVSQMLETPPEEFGLAVLADNVVYLVWLPLLLASRNIADRFNAWTGVSPERIRLMEAASRDALQEERPAEMRDFIYLAAIATGVTWICTLVAPLLYEQTAAAAPRILEWTDGRVDLRVVLSQSTWRILLITTVSLALSATPVSRLPLATQIGTALIYVFVAGMGARASLAGLAQAPPFLLGAFIWIFIHGAFCVLGAKLLKVDVHSTAIASAANIGAAATAPIVAAFHRPSLVPVSVLMALIGYAAGNYLGWAAGHLARVAVGQ